jgi:hypothetical protein
MGKKGSSSYTSVYSSTETTTNTTNNAFDQRLAGTDNAVVIGPGSSNVSIVNTPDSLVDAVSQIAGGFKDLTYQTLQNNQQTINTLSNTVDKKESNNRLLVIGLAGLAVIALISRF